MRRRPPRSTQSRSSAASDVYKRQCQHRAHVVMQHFHLLARNLGPAGVVADDSDHWDAVAHEGIELDQAVAAGAVAINDPDLALGAAQRGAEREAGAYAERAEHAGVEPGKRAARMHD